MASIWVTRSADKSRCESVSLGKMEKIQASNYRQRRLQVSEKVFTGIFQTILADVVECIFFEIYVMVNFS